MSIPDKLESTNDPLQIRISAHSFSAALFLWAKGRITKQNVVDHFGFDSQEEDQLDELAAYYQSLSVEDKAGFHGLIESCNILLEVGAINKTQYRNFLGIS
jgi:hypothetical protein